MKTRLFVAAFMVSLLLLGSCTSIKVVSDHDSSVDFTKFQTFEYHGWAEESNKLLTEFDQRRVENAFAGEFAKRGLKLVEENGDLIVTLYIVTEEKTKTTASTTTMGMGGYGSYYGYGPRYGWGPSMTSSYTTFDEYDYKVGTLVVDVYDANEKKLVWESSGSGTIQDNPNNREERIKIAVSKIMAKYPEPAE
ncbi:MAG: DUF4136 domain-containing protein [Bacteroidota bacterium]